ncbi:unnamed protein product [Candida verbasci]|uniref:Sas10 C-terminal domain-containing protein n=1 Tax=Candida verbasci TaxID=1227364 RepID=A0A9W4XBG9_9ASCO|nr:unnamed protein product [Candida verbasci]
MAKKQYKQQSKQEVDSDLDEVDAFNANREKILLDEAGEYGRNNQSDDDISEEEVMGIDEEDSENESDNIEQDDEDEEDEGIEEEVEVENWGGKKNYYGGDDASDNEESKQMTEEAIRQQKKHLQELAMDDYIDEEMMEDWQKKAESYDKKDTKQQVIIDNTTSIDKLDEEEQVKLLKQSFPEFIPLTKEFNQLNEKLELLKSQESNKFIEVKKVALAGYLSSISSYFAIFVDNLKNNDSFITMKDNPVTETILSSREVWRQANELPNEEVEKEEIIQDEVAPADISSEINEDEFVDAAEEQDEENIFEQSASEAPESDSDLDIDVNSKRVIKRIPKATDDFTEAAIEDVDLEDKKRRKKTLRFYTSKIDKAANKREQSYSGDMDVPYKERLFERQQRLIEEARQRGLEKQDIDINSDNELQEVNDYYNSIKEAKQNKKDARKLAHLQAVQAAKEGKLAEFQENLGEEGKRAINYQILKNKGLTPHRKKENRNSRVKKRKQYEKAQKKLKSVRQVYDSNNRGPYEGEKTGIKKGLSRSVKLI